MFGFKSLVVLLFCLQLQTLVQSDVNVTVAENFLRQLDTESDLSIALIKMAETSIWDSAKATLSLHTAGNVTAEIDYLKRVLTNMTALTANVTGAEECFEGVYALLNATTAHDVVRREDEYFSTLYRLALDEEMNVKQVYKELNDTLEANCVKNVTNCEGTADMIVAEVTRLLPNVKVVPYSLLVNVYVLTYQGQTNLAGYRSELVKDFFKALQKGTACLSGKIKGYKEFQSSKPISQESVSDSYVQLQATVKISNAMSTLNLVSNLNDVMSQCTSEYSNSVADLSNVLNFAEEVLDVMVSAGASVQPNVTDSCGVSTDRFATQDLDDIDKAREALYITLAMGIDSINVTAREVESIGQEVVNCVGQCEYLASKIERKMVEIPQNIRKIELETLVEMALMPMVVRAGGSKGTRNMAEQLLDAVDEINICVQYSMRV